MTGKRRDFTDRFLKSLPNKAPPPGARVDYWDGITEHFSIRIDDKSSPERVGVFNHVARFPGSANPTRRKIGVYPSMSLTVARAICREWDADIKRGVDPKVKLEAQRRQEGKRRAETFSAVLTLYADEKLAGLRTGVRVEGEIRKWALKLDWLKRPIGGITRDDCRTLLGAVKKARAPRNQLLSYFSPFFDWCAHDDRRLIEVNPMLGMERQKVMARDRTLSDDEIRLLWRCWEQDQSVIAFACQMMLATGQRRGEVGGARWDEIDLSEKVWRLPSTRTKAKRAHIVPLNDLALAILDRTPRDSDEFVFAGLRRKLGSDRSWHYGPLSGWDAGKIRHIKITEKLSPDKPIGDWRLHDLRRTAATNLAKLRVPRAIIGAVLNHADGSVTAKHYDWHDYLDEKRDALDRWGARLAFIVGGEGEIIRFPKGKAS